MGSLVDEDKKFTHVQFKIDKITGHYMCNVVDHAGTKIALDLGTDIENVKQVVKVLKEEFGGIHMPNGFMN
jgi:hypothetical protein